jgi:hypothetical protein
VETAPAQATSRRWVFAGVLAVLAVIGYAAGAYGRWILWYPLDALGMWLIIGVILLAGVILVLIPRRPARLVGAGLLALGGAALLAQIVGPSRPELLASSGQLTLTTTTPIPGEASFEASCRSDAAGTEMTLNGDLNMRLDVYDDGGTIPADIDDREFVGVYIETGDRWRDSLNTRADNVFLLIIVSPVVDGMGEVRLRATDASDLELEWTRAGGTLRFAGLETYSEDPTVEPEPVDMAGTVTWTCDA